MHVPASSTIQLLKKSACTFVFALTNKYNILIIHFWLMEDVFLFCHSVDPTGSGLAVILTLTKVLTAMIAISG